MLKLKGVETCDKKSNVVDLEKQELLLLFDEVQVVVQGEVQGGGPGGGQGDVRTGEGVTISIRALKNNHCNL